MIAEGRFRAQLETVGTILRRTSLLEERVLSPNKSLGASVFRGTSYREMYNTCVREFAYDYRLIDHSLLLFTKDGRSLRDGGLSFSYCECPIDVSAYEVFVGSEFGLTQFDDEYEDTVLEVGDSLRMEYEQYVASADAKSLVTPIRYDCKARAYKEGRHPASHVHFGFGNNIRVGTCRIMNPISFALMVVRQCYPTQWESLLRDRFATIWCRNVRTHIDIIDAAYWNAGDQLELVLQ